jgi:nitrate/TMAO reductase-like tetraheme cytochrome c subunit
MARETRFGERLPAWARPLIFLAENRISIAGIALTTAAAFAMIAFWILEAVSRRPIHPYAGILVYMILPGVFVFGLLIIPVGMWKRRADLKRAGEFPAEFPAPDLRSPMFQHFALWAGGMTVLNAALLTLAMYLGIEYMDSNQFCGLTCHTVMAPEYNAFQNSPHSRVGCVGCHIGSGAPWFVRSKLSGVRQVFAVAFKTYQRPIPSPVYALRPARQTCEQCHWPQRFVGEKFVVKTHYAEDEANTPQVTVLLLKVGGHAADGSKGIHGRHLDESAPIRYVAVDGRRQQIARVFLGGKDGKETEYVSSEKITPEQLAKGETRTMDCIDCHNRPSHQFQLPDRALDQALADAKISPKLPFIKKQALELLKSAKGSDAPAQIANGLETFYKTKYPDLYASQKPLVDAAIKTTQAIWGRNVYPDMNLTWGTHPNNLGHMDFPGCFRCHDDGHKAANGRVISQDCENCHSILASDESDPKILKDLGVTINRG